jgi:hypothetical protein
MHFLNVSGSKVDVEGYYDAANEMLKDRGDSLFDAASIKEQKMSLKKFRCITSVCVTCVDPVMFTKRSPPQ